MYRNDEKKDLAAKWDNIATFMQFSSVGALFPIMFILDALPKATARVAVWWMVIPLFIYGTIAYFVSKKALKYKMTYLNAESSRVSGLFDKAIEQFKKEK